MNSFYGQFNALRRPKILINAALFCAQYGARQKCQPDSPAYGGNAVFRLFAEEQRCEEARNICAADYSIREHVEILGNLIAAAQTLRRRRATA